jgi:hypothetical protein
MNANHVPSFFTPRERENRYIFNTVNRISAVLDMITERNSPVRKGRKEGG